MNATWARSHCWPRSLPPFIICVCRFGDECNQRRIHWEVELVLPDYRHMEMADSSNGPHAPFPNTIATELYIGLFRGSRRASHFVRRLAFPEGRTDFREGSTRSVDSVRS